ncbi:MAG: serine/threonine protein kinase [Rhodococcus sp. (in: high G+C Gram-positive bacteria)]|uniref:serine/threonine protein kinase n=1 Tax=Rhodococcus sp. TaxID=1831 RepID=UPI003BB15193
MFRRRWPAIPPPVCGGVDVHGRRRLSAQTDLTLEVLRIVAFESGVSVHLALTATGAPAEKARHQTRPLTDPADHCARWSYLAVRAGVENTDAEAQADAYLPRPDIATSCAGLTAYRTEPRYWLGIPPPVRAVTLTAGWPQIGLAPTTETMVLDVIEQRSNGNPRR